jgi:DNA-binding NarL/FixJ family response regulator
VSCVRVLVVDDHQAFRDAAAVMIEVTPGFVLVGEAGTGEAALELMTTAVPELVLMDVNMPGMGGLRAAEVLRRNHPDVLVVLISTEDRVALASDPARSAPYLSKACLSPDTLRDLWLTEAPASNSAIAIERGDDDR